MSSKKNSRVVFIMLCLSIVGNLNAQQFKTGKLSTINKNWQSGGIFDGKIPQQELLSARTEYTKNFEKGNDILDIYFGGPFHFLDNSGAWQDTNLKIENTEESSNHIKARGDTEKPKEQ